MYSLHLWTTPLNMYNSYSTKFKKANRFKNFLVKLRETPYHAGINTPILNTHS